MSCTPNGRAGLTSCCSLVDLKTSMFPEGSEDNLLCPLMAGPVMFCGFFVWLWLKTENTVHEHCKSLNMCMVRLKTVKEKNEIR